MPRWACRLRLEVTAIRMEQLQAISRNDAEAEGMNGSLTPLVGYRILWDQLNAKRGYGWDKNPWVWVIEFKRANDIFDQPRRT